MRSVSFVAHLLGGTVLLRARAFLSKQGHQLGHEVQAKIMEGSLSLVQVTHPQGKERYIQR